MKKTIRLSMMAFGVVVLTACGGGDDDNDDAPSVPLVQQSDRTGRPGVNTVLIASENKDAYNQAANPADWPLLFQADIQTHLEAVDALDNIVGNALLGDSNALAGVLVDDQLLIDTSVAECDAYLAVELGVPGQCGGRTLARDVIDDTLTALVGSPLSDNVPNDSAFLSSFPFLGPANGVQIDRMGRPAINTALIPPHLHDAYNRAEDRAFWSPLFKDEIILGLDFADGLDGIPGNAPLGDSAALADIVVDDRLQINTAVPTCDVFLAVEVNVTTDCGGRNLSIDVIDDVLAALVGGNVSDNVTSDSAFSVSFPFLAEPN